MKMHKVSVVLANLMSSKGVLNNETKARLDLARKLDSESKSEIIFLCGWAYRPDCSITIADAMKDYLSGHSSGFENRIVCQKFSRDTVGDAVFTCLYLLELFEDLSSVDLHVITSDYHARRTKEVFTFVFGNSPFISVHSSPTLNGNGFASKELDSLEAFRKTFSTSSSGDLHSIYLSLRNNHPFYNGLVHPQIEEMNEASRHIKRLLCSS